MKKIYPIELENCGELAINFIVHYPYQLPEDSQLVEASLRPERPPGRCADDEQITGLCPWTQGNPSNLRMLISGKKRQLRIKQFFYDWAPPAAGLPCLWESPELQAVATQKEIAWFGTDYKKNYGISLLRNGTLIELSVLSGHYTDTELTEIIDNLKPINTTSPNNIAHHSFFERNYWVRYKHEGIKVPHGLYRYNTRHYFNKATPLNLSEIPVGEPALYQPPDQFIFDSAICISDDTILEYHILYISQYNHSDQLWLQIEVKNEHTAIQFPLELDDHPVANTECIHYKRHDIYFATAAPQYGGHEAYWQTHTNSPQLSIALWSSTSQNLDYNNFKDLVFKLIA